ncbi:MAG: diaminopimelate decarboxylase [Schleiferiaceae bacterium]|jgi:diaminopimelate decarboxylase|nr:diaminopimelate decarboxylase [Schleiferiaceae bacterium]
MELANNKYHIQNVDVLSMVEEHGSPLFVYDADVIKRQYQRMDNAISYKHKRLNFACKSLSNINILRYMRSLGAGLDTVSIQEVQMGLRAGFTPDEIMYTPNCVSFEEIQEAVQLGVRVNIDNLSILEHFGHLYGDRYPVCIRLNPHIMAGGNHKISVGHIDSKFGISIHQMRHLERIIQAYGIHVNGVHMHTGSDILNIDAFASAVNILLDCARSFKELEFIDFGSGFKVPYKPNDLSTDIEAFGEHMSKIFAEFCLDYGKELRMEFEPGKYLVSESGTFFTTVNVLKQTPATVFAGVNTGFNHFIRPMFYDAYHHMVNVSNPNGKPRVYTVVGYICETDTFGWDRQIEEIHEGDVLAFKNAGAYVFTMASNFNSRLKPAEVFVINGKAYVISKRQTFDDLLANQVELGDEILTSQIAEIEN